MYWPSAPEGEAGGHALSITCRVVSTPFTGAGSTLKRACVIPEVDKDATAIINYTSGTTGFSKGVMLTYRQT